MQLLLAIGPAQRPKRSEEKQADEIHLSELANLVAFPIPLLKYPH